MSVSDFSRFKDLVATVMDGTDSEKEEALLELGEDVANIEVLVKVAVLRLLTTPELQKHYDEVWDQ